MYVVTNRKLDEEQTGLKVFSAVPNEKGPNELRLVKVTRSGSGYRTEILEDKLNEAVVVGLKKKFSLDIDETQQWYASLSVACALMEEARKKKRHVLFFVHGYNNDMNDVMATATRLERAYKAIVVPFSWPANGGGAVSGTLAYLSDKQDARVSADAFSRFVGLVRKYHGLLVDGRRAELMARVTAEHPANLMERQAALSRLLERECSVTINLMCHSMGNYLFKYALLPGNSAARSLTFDNVSLVAADANNEAHEIWVSNIQARNRIYVVINENDGALEWSRRKPGDEQGPRLGHYLRNLVAGNTHYLNVTPTSWVKDDHSYFKGEPIAKNDKLKEMFSEVFSGGRAEESMRYRGDINAYEIR